MTRLIVDGRTLEPAPLGKARHVAERETTFLVTNMMRSVVNEGTGASARAAGFLLDAAGKSGTTNELRDAWFVGFTPELLTVVWVGLDDNRPLGMSGTQAALPIWTTFMLRALAGHASQSFAVPEQVIFAEIDPEIRLSRRPRLSPHDQRVLHARARRPRRSVRCMDSEGSGRLKGSEGLRGKARSCLAAPLTL